MQFDHITFLIIVNFLFLIWKIFSFNSIYALLIQKFTLTKIWSVKSGCEKLNEVIHMFATLKLMFKSAMNSLSYKTNLIVYSLYVLCFQWLWTCGEEQQRCNIKNERRLKGEKNNRVLSQLRYHDDISLFWWCYILSLKKNLWGITKKLRYSEFRSYSTSKQL